MSPEYKLLSTTDRPFHLYDGGHTKVYVYDVSPDTYAFLCMVDTYEHDPYNERHSKPYDPDVVEAKSLRNAVLNDLEIYEEGITAPGAPYYRYEVALIGGCVILAETFAYNI